MEPVFDGTATAAEQGVDIRTSSLLIVVAQVVLGLIVVAQVVLGLIVVAQVVLGLIVVAQVVLG